MVRKCWGAVVMCCFVVVAQLAGAQEQAQSSPNAIALTVAQKQVLKKADDDMKSQSGPLALKLASTLKDFDRNLLSEKTDAEADRKLGNEVADALAGIIQFRLAQVRDTAKVLTAEQKKALLAVLEKPDSNPDLIELVKKVLVEAKE